MSNPQAILKESKDYFVQQAELYGEEFYLESDLIEANAGFSFGSLDDFARDIANCQKCDLCNSRSQVVFGIGNPQAKLMCVGEAPGFEEDKQGEPFVGAAGQLLDKILASVGFERTEVYIANIIKCRPPNNRDPEPMESETCLPYLKKQIEMIQPKIILALGRIAAHNLLKSENPLSTLRGQTHKIDDVSVIVTYHPAALLRNQDLKRQTWVDVKKLRRLYDEIVGDKPLINFDR